MLYGNHKLLADENAVDHRAMDVEELIPDVVEEDEPEANECRFSHLCYMEIIRYLLN